MTKSRLCPLESAEGKTFNQWADYHPIARHALIHITNEQKTSYYYGKHLNDQGRRKGVSDYFLAYPHKGLGGLWIELKRTNKNISRPTAEQMAWLEYCQGVGYATKVAYGAEDAIQTVMDYLL